ncbi:MAG: CDP-glycerol glycerophosphotransferase family protein, partial [Candidatus Nitrosotenuis sp.]
FDRSNLYVTGNPIYDATFKKLHSLTNSKNTGKIRVLFAPLQLYENGLWSKNHQESSIKEIVSKLANNPDVLLTIKLHPSSIALSDYENMIRSIEPYVQIFQSGDIIDYLSNTDVLVSFPGSSTIFVYALAAEKPIILCNFYNQERHQFLEKDLAVECKKPESLIDQIKSSASNNQLFPEKIRTFLEESFYKTDGQASERLSNAIIDFLNKKKQ